jgi:ubiquinone/menaquinone biosynthesis C-methylase UbiE
VFSPGELAPPTVDSSTYDTDYYLHSCMGFTRWVESDGAQYDPFYVGSLSKSALKDGDVVVDIGTGRGELLCVAVERGATMAIGVEYSLDALKLARKTARAFRDPSRIALLAADSRRIPLADGSADLVTMLDIVEHLTPDELHATLLEVGRILRPGGHYFAHTFPTTTLYNVTYRLQRLAVPTRWKTWKKDPRNEYEHTMHVNEQSRSSLSRALKRAGLASVRVTPGDAVFTEFLPNERSHRLYHRLASRRLTKGFGACDLWAEGTKPS